MSRKKKPGSFTIQVSMESVNGKSYYFGYVYRGRRCMTLVSGATEAEAIQNGKKYVSQVDAETEYGTRTFEL